MLGTWLPVAKILFSAIVMLAVPAQTAFAASESACSAYANHAIAQYKEAKELGLAAPFPVWSDNFQHHYGWCLGQAESILAQGSAQRQAELEKAKALRPQAPPVAPFTAETLPAQTSNLGNILAASRSDTLVGQVRLASGKAHLVQAAGPGARVYGDRDFRYTRLPQDISGAVHIATLNDDKFVPENVPYLRFTLNGPATVYVAYDPRYRLRPGWLGDFRDTDLEAGYTTGSAGYVQRLYSKRFSAGEVALGGNFARGEEGNFGMYTVFVAAEKGSAVSLETAEQTVAASQVGGQVPGAAQTVGQQQTFEPLSSSRNAGRVAIPLLMYYVERQLVGVPDPGEADQYVAGQFHASPATREFFSELLQKYKAIPVGRKNIMFDKEMVQRASSPFAPISRDEIDNAYRRLEMSVAVGKLAMQENPPPPNAPGRLITLNSYGGSFEQQGGNGVETYGIFLQWRWDWPDTPQGFAIYRRRPSETQFGFLTELSADTLEFRDTPLPAPSGLDSAYCYEVRAFTRPPISVKWQSNRIESPPSNSSCTPYGKKQQQLPDTDQDGMPDPFDWCPADGYAQTVQRVNGCPDLDRDGFADAVQDPAIPKSLRDNCPPGSNADGYGLRGPDWDHLRAFDPLPGCPVKYQLRWTGLDILNNPIDCTNPNAPGPGCDSEVGLGDEYGQQNEIINGQTLPPGFEPYVVFGMLNGISPQGMAQQWTKKWCCGEGVDAGTVSVPDFPPATIKASATEPDQDFRGAEAWQVDQKVLDKGMTLLPEESDEFVTIDALGMTLTTTLFERDFDMQYTPEKNEADISGFLSKGVGMMKTIVGCGSTGGLGCAKALGESLAALISFGFSTNDKPDPVTVKDRDDVMGTTSVSFTGQSAAAATAAAGVYAFSVEIPGDGAYFVSFPSSLVPPPKLDSRARLIATMAGRARFCLIRKGLDENQIKQLCQF